MSSVYFLPVIDEEVLNEALTDEHDYHLMEVLVTPLHEALYKKQTFDFLDELTENQQLILCYDYVLAQVNGGGFLQLLHNGYAGLLLDLPAQFQNIGDVEMSVLLDDVLKFFVPNKDIIEKEMSVEDFAKLYPQFPEAEMLDQRFISITATTMKKINDYARHNLHEFMKLGEEE